MTPIAVDGRSLIPDHVADVACSGRPVHLTDDARLRMSQSATWYATQHPEGILQDKWAWLTGSEAPTTDALVSAFVLGHCAGVGEPLAPEIVRAMLLVRLNVLATGTTGCRPQCADVLIAMLNADVVPIVPSQGSVGAAGDLAPLAHAIRVAARLGGEAWRNGQRLPAKAAMEGLPPLDLCEKEALSLINGASLTAGIAGLACARSARLLETAEAACALSFEVCRADLGCLSPGANAARNHPGPQGVAARIRKQLEQSENVAHGRRPDPFSIRCAPAVMGTAHDALDHICEVTTRELNGACDNPLVLPDEGLIEAGNFHGAPVALAMDHLKLALTQVASISERRVFRMTHGQLTGLPSFLVANTGLNNGLMIAQYTAASLVSEAKTLSHSSSVDSLPTVQHHEDHVSMGPIAARGALHHAELLADVLAIELLCAAQGLDFHLAGEAVDTSGASILVPPTRAGTGTTRTWERVREHVPRWTRDRVLHPDIAALGHAVRRGDFTQTQGTW